MTAGQPELTDGEIRGAVRELAGRFDDTYWAGRDASGEFPWDFYNAFADGRLAGHRHPGGVRRRRAGRHGGRIVAQEIAASGAGMNGCSAVHIGDLRPEPIIRHGGDDLKRRFLPRGRRATCTSPSRSPSPTQVPTPAGSRPSPGRSTAAAGATGKKVWITKAQRVAERLCCSREPRRRRRAAEATDGLTLFFVDLDPRRDHDAARSRRWAATRSTSNELFIDELFVARRRVVGRGGAASRYLLDGLNPERILLAHEALGIGRAALRRAVRYANDRIVFGRPIGQNQGIAFPLAEACDPARRRRAGRA